MANCIVGYSILICIQKNKNWAQNMTIIIILKIFYNVKRTETHFLELSAHELRQRVESWESTRSLTLRTEGRVDEKS